MAKTKKISSDTTITVNPKSKNKTYVIDSASALNIEYINEKNKTYVTSITFGIKRGNDLVLETVYTTKSYKTKIISTTIKNYFTETVEHEVKFYMSSEIPVTIKPSDASGKFVAQETLDDSNYPFITGTLKADNYSIGHSSIVYDKKGNDTYTSVYDSGVFSEIMDLVGNDKYVYDNKNNLFFVEDYSGNDEYYVKGSSKFSNNDIKGNDTYEFTNTTKEQTVHDKSGKDIYTITDTTGSCRISDNSGKDEYTISKSNRIFINDRGKGNDTYTVSNCTGVRYWNDDDGSYSTFTISDEKGNETYDFQNLVFSDHEYFDPDKSEYALCDMSGNDKYKLKGCGYFRALDKKGNDNITIQNSESIYFDDLSGNDRWTLKRTDNLHTLNEIYAIDEKGNDKWTITGVKDIVNGGGFASIWDKAGKDNYLMNGGSDGVEITDEIGNDKYTITEGSKNFSITDKAGKDTYKIIGSSDNHINTPYLRDTGASNDKYTLKYVDNNVNSWNAIVDDGGKDTYNLANCNAIKMEDLSGNDKYNIIATETLINSVTIADNSGKDTYNIKGSYSKKTKKTTYLNSATIIDEGIKADVYNLQYARRFNISDNAGDKDKYTIKSSYGNITDYGNGNDSYTVSKMVDKSGIWLDDRGGNKDILKLSDVNKKDIVFMTNYGTNGHGSLTADEDASLILFNKKNNSFVQIKDFFTDSNNDCVYEGFGNGKIETIKAGSKKVTVSADYFTDDIRYQVLNFLDSNDCSVIEYLNKETQEDINVLIAVFRGEEIYGH